MGEKKENVIHELNVYKWGNYNHILHVQYLAVQVYVIRHASSHRQYVPNVRNKYRIFVCRSNEKCCSILCMYAQYIQ